MEYRNINIINKVNIFFKYYFFELLKKQCILFYSLYYIKKGNSIRLISYIICLSCDEYKHIH